MHFSPPLRIAIISLNLTVIKIVSKVGFIKKAQEIPVIATISLNFTVIKIVSTVGFIKKAQELTVMFGAREKSGKKKVFFP